jgi:hypothetical protein
MQVKTISRKRQEFRDMVEHYFGSDTLIAIEGAKPGMSAAEKK